MRLSPFVRVEDKFIFYNKNCITYQLNEGLTTTATTPLWLTDITAENFYFLGVLYNNQEKQTYFYVLSKDAPEEEIIQQKEILCHLRNKSISTNLVLTQVIQKLMLGIGDLESINGKFSKSWNKDVPTEKKTNIRQIVYAQIQELEHFRDLHRPNYYKDRQITPNYALNIPSTKITSSKQQISVFFKHHKVEQDSQQQNGALLTIATIFQFLLNDELKKACIFLALLSDGVYLGGLEISGGPSHQFPDVIQVLIKMQQLKLDQNLQQSQHTKNFKELQGHTASQQSESSIVSTIIKQICSYYQEHILNILSLNFYLCLIPLNNQNKTNNGYYDIIMQFYQQTKIHRQIQFYKDVSNDYFCSLVNLTEKQEKQCFKSYQKITQKDLPEELQQPLQTQQNDQQFIQEKKK